MTILNWSPEVVLDMVLGVLALTIVASTLIIARMRNIRSIKLIDLGISFMALIMLFEAFSVLYMDVFLYMMCTLSVFLSVFFLALAINYVTRESFISKDLVFVVCLGALHLYLTFQSDQYVKALEMGFLTITWTGALFYVGNLTQFLLFIYFFYWGLKSYLNAPYSIKKTAALFFFGTNILSIVPVSLIVFTFFEPLLIVVIEILMIVGLITIQFSVLYDPKLLYILPFRLLNLIVRDKKGNLLFDHNWSDIELDASVFAGFLNALKIMSERVMNVGEPFEISLKKGILIIHDSDDITVGLISSKSSKLLQSALVKFTTAFQERFRVLLQKGVTNQKQYESAFELIEQYFSNFPYSFIKDKKEQLLLPIYIPPQLEYKLNDAFKGDPDLDNIKKEFARAPTGIIREFISLHEELDQEFLGDSTGEVKKFENKKDL
ncbi:MAG: hypothetical protein JW891_15970 [Candidatus Lokiarchaeota archaeon]|nr:hypothetical protein [Candidatus Lokiarchaeota archaeon]